MAGTSSQRGRGRLWLSATATVVGMILLGCGAPQPNQTAQEALATGVPAARATASALAPTVEAAASGLASRVEARASELGAAASGAAATVEAAASSVAATAQAARTDVAATVEAVEPTAEALASNLAATAQAVQSDVAATVEALEPTAAALQTAVAAPVEARLTEVAPTAAALATAVAATVQPAVATSVAASPVEIAEVRVSPDDTTIALRNRGTEQVVMAGWVLVVDVVPLVLPVGPYPQLDPGETLTYHFARGADTEQDVYMGQAPQGLLDRMQPGANIILLSPRGEVASIYRLP